MKPFPPPLAAECMPRQQNRGSGICLIDQADEAGTARVIPCAFGSPVQIVASGVKPCASQHRSVCATQLPTEQLIADATERGEKTWLSISTWPKRFR